MTLFSDIITSVKFQLKLFSAKFLLSFFPAMNSRKHYILSYRPSGIQTLFRACLSSKYYIFHSPMHIELAFFSI